MFVHDMSFVSEHVLIHLKVGNHFDIVRLIVEISVRKCLNVTSFCGWLVLVKKCL